jgi:hypothetical protein
MSKGKGKNTNFIPGAGNRQGGAGTNNTTSIKNQAAHNQTSRTLLTNPSHIGGRGGK